MARRLTSGEREVGRLSVTEIVPRGEGFERTPPHDLAAEQCVLGGMMLSKDAISDVLDVIRAQDYYRPAHQIIHDVILDLYGRGEPADAVTVAAELTRTGDIGRMGGAPYLHTLIASVPTAANAGYYARIVRERAILRRLVEVGTRIVQLGYAGDGDADELVDRAEAEVYGVTDRRVTEDYLPLAEIMPGALDEIEAIGSRGGTLAGVPTGFADLDALTNGLHPGQMVVIAARPAMGKALAVDTPLPTPAGWTTMGEVRVGDQLLGADGRAVTVVAATQVMTDRPCFEVVFDDHTTIVADAEHQWVTAPVSVPAGVLSRSSTVVSTTAQLAQAVRDSSGSPAHAVQLAAPLDLPAPRFSLPPYVLGGWLARPYVRALRSARTDSPQELCSGVQDDGRIPSGYLRASRQQRRALLAGLLDAGGTVDRTGAVRFTARSAGLADDVRELLVSLGYRCCTAERTRPGWKRSARTARTVTFTTADDVFWRGPQGADHQRLTAASSAGYVRQRMIVDVRPVDSVPVRCVQVDAPDSLYLASRSMIPTHNSALALDIARAASVKSGLTSVLFSLEMSRNEITMRLLSAEARVPLHAMRTGQLGEDDWTRLARRMSEVVDAPLFIDDSPNMSMVEIRSKCRRLKQRNDLKLVIIDYLQLMSSPKRVENRQQEVSELSRSLKLLAKELQVPVVALAQLNRGPEMRTDKRPLLADLRESGCLTADTRIVRADTGVEVKLGDLLAAGARDVPVWSLNERLQLVPSTLTHVFPTGTREVFRVRLKSGREVTATASHPFLTYQGWRALGELTAGHRVAVPRTVPEPLSPSEMPEAEIIMLAHRLGDGSLVLRGHEKFVPTCVFSLPTGQLALFLRHLWATEGSVTAAASGFVGVNYSTRSERLARELQILLSRFGIKARLRAVDNTHGRTQWTVDVEGAEDQRRFLERVGVHGATANVARALQRLDSVTPAGRFDTIPPTVWDRVRRAMAERPVPAARSVPAAKITAAVGTSRSSDLSGAVRPSSTRLERIAQALDDAELEMMATNDVFWDAISSVESLGDQPVYDATVSETHNFIANGINLHNSIEQDADVVILLHREDLYERESPRAGEADLIVAKHRNGPTTTVTVAFQGHYSRFVDMAPI